MTFSMLSRKKQKLVIIFITSAILFYSMNILSVNPLNEVTESEKLNKANATTVTSIVTDDVGSKASTSEEVNSLTEINSKNIEDTVSTVTKTTAKLETQSSTTESTASKVTTSPEPKSNNIISNVPVGHSFKSYTNYRLLSKNSPQGRLQTLAYSDENGLRKVGEYYCVALGSYYGTTIGDCYIVTLSTGNQFKMCLCDCKANAHTDANNQYSVSNGCITEFYVDYTCFNSRARSAGSISAIPGFEGDITSITKLEGINAFNLN